MVPQLESGGKTYLSGMPASFTECDIPRLLESNLVTKVFFFAVCLMAFEVLHFPLVLLGRAPGLERAEVSSLSCLGILLARIQPVLTR